MASNPELTDEIIRQNLRKLTEPRRAAFVYNCQRFNPETGEFPQQTMEMRASLNLSQSRISENLKAACIDLKIPWPGKTKEEDLNPPDVEKRLEMLRRYSEVIKADYPIDTQPDLPPQPAPEPAKPPPTPNGGIEEVLANLQTGEAPPASQRIIRLPFRDALIFAGSILLVGGLLSFFLFRPTANRGATEPQPTQTARVEVITQTVVVVPSPQVTVIVETPLPLPSQTPYPTQEPLPTLAPVIIVVTATPPPATATPEISPTPAPTETPVATETPTKPLVLPFKDSFTNDWSPMIRFIDGEPAIVRGALTPAGGSNKELILELGDQTLDNYVVEFDYFIGRGAWYVVNFGSGLRIYFDFPGNLISPNSYWQREIDGSWVNLDLQYLPYENRGHFKVTIKGDTFIWESGGASSSVIVKGIKARGPVSLRILPGNTLDNLSIQAIR